MAPYIDKSALVAEIEKLKLYTMDEHMKFYSECAEAEYNALCKVEETIDSLQEEPVSEDLNTAAKEYANNITDKLGYRLQLRRAVCFGAKWQIGQFEKNRLAACDAQTEEEAEIERDFVSGIIEKEHRPPTFNDAIKYGYHQAEKDLELGWEDMRELYIIFAEIDVDIELCKTDIKVETLGYYQEVLKRFKDFKERKEV